MRIIEAILELPKEGIELNRDQLEAQDGWLYYPISPESLDVMPRNLEDCPLFDEAER